MFYKIIINQSTQNNKIYAVGNPTTYRGKSATWIRGRKLAYYSGTAFEYDAQGKRTKKNNIEYTYDSQGRLLKQSNGLEFYYDTTGLVGLKYNNINYVYRKDVQGNIIAILDSSGNIVVEYSYDAWGNHTISGTNMTLGTQNPFRYRSYYYDTETGLYYLQTRYYDPEIGRWINIDNPLTAFLGKSYLGGLNLYAYCFNDPVNYVDFGGLFPVKIYIRIDDFGQQSEHVHINYNGNNYSWYKIGHKKRHSKDLGHDDVSKSLKKKLKDAGLSDEYFSKSIIINSLPKWQESFSYVAIPPYQEGFSHTVVPPYQEGFDNIVVPPYQEGLDHTIVPPYKEEFSSPQIDTGMVVAITAIAIFAIACIALAFFTGGQSLWGLAVLI